MLEVDQRLSLDVESMRLANGLQIFLHQDHSAPMVAVHVCYHVGSKDESPERTGLAHLFEHLMFEGSAGWDDDYFKPLQEAGASVNGSTGHDYTSYYEVVPSNFLDLALWLEADRMANLLPALSSAKLENQRSVVKNERHQRVDNQPYGRVSEEIFSLLYASDHPYHWPIIGWPEHLDAISMDDVTAFFKRHYAPSTAVLVLAGSFDRDAAIRSIERTLGGIPPGVTNGRWNPLPGRIHGEYRRTMSEQVGLARLDLVWPSVPRLHPDEHALDFAAQILAGGRENRLRKALQRDRRLAHSVDAYHSSLALAGQFGIRAFALSGESAETIEPIASDTLASLITNPPTEDEMLRAQNAFLNQAFSRLETNLSKASLIQHYAFHSDQTPESIFAHEIAAYRTVRAQDVVRVVQQYLGENRLVVQVAPGEAIATSKPAHSTTAIAKARLGGDPSKLPAPGPNPHFASPKVEVDRVGRLKVAVVRTPGKPRILAELVTDAGAVLEHADHLGRAKLTGYCLDEGTLATEGPQLASRIELLGAAIRVSPGIECMTVSLRSLRSNWNESFELLADIIANPAFRPVDVTRERDRLVAELAHKANQPRALADDAIDERIFGTSHPYGRTSDGTVESLSAQSSEDLQSFHRSFVQPDRSTMIVVGDISLEDVMDRVSASLGQWVNSTGASDSENAKQPLVPSQQVQCIERAQATQSVLRIGCAAPPRTTPDYESLVILNTILGGQFSSRLNAKLREEMGVTYGAQSSFILRRWAGSFLAGTDVDARFTHVAIQAMLDEILALAKHRPITADELDFAKAYITRRFPARFETNAGILSHLTHTAVYGLPIDYYDRYLDRIQAVTRDDVCNCAQRYLSPEGIKVVVVGRSDSLEDLDERIATLLDG